MSLGITFEWEGILIHCVHDIISVSLKVSAESIQASRAKKGDHIKFYSLCLIIILTYCQFTWSHPEIFYGEFNFTGCGMLGFLASK